MKDTQKIFLLILISFALAGIGGEILKILFNRPRPISEFAGALNVLSSPGTASFPSGHSVTSIALVLPFLYFANYQGSIHQLTKIILALLVIFICFSRIILGAHFLSDVLAAFGWAFLMFPLAIVLSNLMLKKITQRNIEKVTKILLFLYVGLIIILVIV
jgi:undecaprenyl-diphosphatase